MSVPSHQTENNLATEGYKQYRISSPTSAQITRATTYFFDLIKQEMMNLGREWAFLRKTAYLPCTVNVSKVQAPTDYAKLISAQVLDGTRRGTAQAGASTNLTLAAADAGTEAGTEGKWLVITGGTGSGQGRQIKDFNTTTKVATVDEAWTTTPSTDSTYLVADIHYPLVDRPVYRLDEIRLPNILGLPKTMYHEMDTTEGDFLFDYVPDSIYAIQARYYCDLRKLDTDTSTNPLYAEILTLCSDLFIQGTKVLLEQNDARALQDDAKFQQMLAKKASQYLYPNNSNQDTELAQDIY